MQSNNINGRIRLPVASGPCAFTGPAHVIGEHLVEGFGAGRVEARKFVFAVPTRSEKGEAWYPCLRSCSCVTVHAFDPDPIGERKKTNADLRREVDQRLNLVGAKKELRRIERDKTNWDDVRKCDPERVTSRPGGVERF